MSLASWRSPVTRAAHPDARERGIALITALVVVAIAAGLAVAMHWQNSLDTRRTITLVQGDQALEYALGAEAWAEQILARSAVHNPNVTALNQDWAQQLPPLPVEGGQILGHIEDLQGRFNINNVATPEGKAQFGRLLQALNQDPLIADAVADWMTANSLGGPGGAKDDYYSRLQPPYLTSEMPMTSITELLLVKGVTPQVYAQISPYVCALPLNGPVTGGFSGNTNPPLLQGHGGGTQQASGPAGGASQAMTPINLNTALAPVIESLDPKITPDLAAQVVGLRGSTPFKTTPQPLAFINLRNVAYDSNYFLLTVTAEIGSTHVTLYSLLQRGPDHGVVAVRRTIGTL